MPTIELKNVNKYVCCDVNLKIADKELLVLLGPNGGGKTTLLSIIAGLTGYSGSVLFDDKVMDKVPASKRQVGYLFQNLVLFPHLDVTANVAYGLRNGRPVTEQIEEEANDNEIIDKLKLAGNDGNGLFMIDKELGARVFTPSASAE